MLRAMARDSDKLTALLHKYNQNTQFSLNTFQQAIQRYLTQFQKNSTMAKDVTCRNLLNFCLTYVQFIVYFTTLSICHIVLH
jgi:hypothetical protein